MAAFGGQIRLDGGPVHQTWLHSMGALLARRAPDRQVCDTAGPAGLVYRHYGGPEEEATSSLWRSPAGAVLAFDGRLDNGRDLAGLLGLTGIGAVPDSVILLAGFQRFGPRFAGKMVGDYSFGYWDPVTHQFSLGRDAAGVRTLYYHHSAQALTFATDLGSLVRSASLSTDLDDEYIAGYLSYGPPDHLTAYRNVKPVRPGTVVTLPRSGIPSEEETWSLAETPSPISYRHDEEYEEHFHSLFADAISVRLRTPYPVVAELSGGLDSSSVVTMADHLIRTGTAAPPSLSTVSRVFDRSTTANELAYIEEVERHCKRESCHVVESRVPHLMMATGAEHLHVVSHLSLIAGYDSAVCERMELLGAHLLLSGTGGDEMFYPTNDPLPYLGDLWTRLNVKTLHRELRTWSAAIQRPYTDLLWRSFKTSLLRSYLPPRWMNWTGWNPPSWVHASLRDRVAAIAELYERRLRPYKLPSQRDHVAGYHSVVRGIANGHRQEFHARQITYPCLHRPLVEFLHAIPFSQKLRCGESRSLQRRALRRLLPPRIATRRGKSDGNEAVMRGLREGTTNWEALLSNSEVGTRCYVDVAHAINVLRRAKAGVHSQEFLNRAIALEIWLRTHHGGGGRLSSQIASQHQVVSAAS